MICSVSNFLIARDRYTYLDYFESFTSPSRHTTDPISYQIDRVGDTDSVSQEEVPR